MINIKVLKNITLLAKKFYQKILSKKIFAKH